MTLAVERAAAVALIILGLSHFIQAGEWSRFFVKLFATETAAFIIALYTLPVGLLIVVTHNVWVWDWPVIVTLYGWGALAKATVYLLYPAAFRRVAERRIGQPASFRIVGVLMIAMGALVARDAFAGGS